MENNTMYQAQPQTNNAWKVTAIISIAIAVVLAVLVGVFATRNQTSNNIFESTTASDCLSDTNYANENGASVASNDNRRYLTINEWGVQFEIPYGFESITYTLDGDNAVLLTGRLITNMMTGDPEDDVKTGLVGTLDTFHYRISRYDEPVVENMLKIGDYYFTFIGIPFQNTLFDVRTSSLSEISAEMALRTLFQSASRTLSPIR